MQALLPKPLNLFLTIILPTNMRFRMCFHTGTISDVFDEGSYIQNHNLVPFGAVFGLINYQGLRKATFNGFKMMNMMGTTRVSLTGGSGDADGVDGFATLSQDSTKLTILVYRYYKTFSTVKPDTAVTITINNMPFANGTLKMTHYRG